MVSAAAPVEKLKPLNVSPYASGKIPLSSLSWEKREILHERNRQEVRDYVEATKDRKVTQIPPRSDGIWAVPPEVVYNRIVFYKAANNNSGVGCGHGGLG